jgi:hypothetical protein
METIKITTPIDKIAVELKPYITGGENRQIQNIFMEMAKVNVETGGVVNTSLEGKSEIMNKAQDKTIELMVVSVDGSKEDIVKKVLDLKSVDFEFVIAEINKVTSDAKKK